MISKRETALNVPSIQGPVAFQTRGESKLQPLVKVLCDLIDFMNQTETHIPVPLAKIEYEHLATRLDVLLDLVDGDEDHPSAPLLHFVGTLIKNYEDEHIPKLTEV